MNYINRIIIVMLLLALIFVACAAFGVVLATPPAVATTINNASSVLFQPQLNPTRVVCLGIALIGAVFGILLLYLEVMPSGKMRMHLKSIQGADVIMSSDAITTQLQYALDPLPGVIRATPKVYKGKNDSLDVSVDLVATSDVDVKQKTNEVMDVTRSVVEGGLGLRVGKVQIKMEQMKPPKKGVPPQPKMDLPKLISAKQEEANENAAQGG